MQTKKIKMPKDLSEVTLSQYQSIKAIPEDADEDFAMGKILGLLTNIHPSEVPRLGIKSKFKLLEEVKETLVEKESYKLEDRIKADGLDNGFIPNLDNINVNEFIDLDSNYGDVKNWHKFMAVCYRPISDASRFQKGAYLIEPYSFTKERADIMKHVTMDIVLGAMLFFCRLGSELAIATLKSGVAEAHQNQNKSHSQRNGDGTIAFMHLAVDDLKKLPERLVNIHSIKRLISLRLNQIKTI